MASRESADILMTLLRHPGLRPELRANLRLALPIIATQFTFMGMGTVDTLMAGRLGGDALAAVAVGANVWFLLFIAFSGILMACSPIVAQRIGARADAADIGRFVRGAAVFAVMLGLVWMLAMRVAATPVLSLLSRCSALRSSSRGGADCPCTVHGAARIRCPPANIAFGRNK